MSRPITAKIAVNKILKEHMFKGKKHTYLDLAIWPNKNGPDEDGYTHYITQQFSKEAREAGVKGEILGNLKMPQDEAPRRQAAPPARRPAPPADPDLDAGGDDSGIPF